MIKRPNQTWLAVTVCITMAANMLTGSAFADVASSLAGAERPEADTSRDASRKPAQVLEFLGVQSGMTVMDVLAAGGWYTEVLAHAVGPDGVVYAQNSAGMLQFRDGANEKAISQRLADGRLPNVTRVNREIEDLGVEAGSVDVAITALNFHDIYNSAGAEATGQFLDAIYAVLKPGGVFGVIDHVGDSDNDNSSLHRMDVDAARAVIEKSRFVLDASSDVLHNSLDDHSKMIFDPSLGRNTDRFVWRLKKPD